MPDSVRTAQLFLENLYAGDYAKAADAFDPAFKNHVNDQSLSTIWKQVESLFGKPVKHTATRTSRTVTGTADIIYLSWDFEKERVDARIVVNKANRIVGAAFETPVIK
jgi:hypothetical protein